MSRTAPKGLGGKRVVRANAHAAARVQRIQLRSSRRTSGPRGRVVVKANYIRVGAGNTGGRASAFAAVNYMLFRPGEDGEVRKGFDGQMHLEAHEVHQRVGDQSQAHKYAYRIVMSPDRNFGEKATEEWAAKTLGKLGYTDFLIVAHAGEKGHTAHPHAHVLVFTDARLERTDFQRLRDFGDVQAKEIEMRLRFDRHMDMGLWKEMKDDEFKQWKLSRDLRAQVKSDGIDDLANKVKKEQKKEEKESSKHVGMEM